MCKTNGDADIKTTDKTSRVLGGNVFHDKPDEEELVTTSIFLRDTTLDVTTHIVGRTMDVTYGNTFLSLPEQVYLAIAAQVEEKDRNEAERAECARVGCSGNHGPLWQADDNIIKSTN